MPSSAMAEPVMRHGGTMPVPAQGTSEPAGAGQHPTYSRMWRGSLLVVSSWLLSRCLHTDLHGRRRRWDGRADRIAVVTPFVQAGGSVTPPPATVIDIALAVAVGAPHRLVCWRCLQYGTGFGAIFPCGVLQRYVIQRVAIYRHITQCSGLEDIAWREV